MKSYSHDETEVKLRVADAAAMRRKLAKLGARPLQASWEHNTLYDTRLRELAKHGQLLRVRRNFPLRGSRPSGGARLFAEGPGLVTFKAPGAGDGRFKVRKELEVAVEHAGQFGEILSALGYQPWFRYEKRRTTFRLPRAKGVEVCFDETPIGVFLELEGSPEGIDRAARLLGFEPRSYITANYLALYMEACRREGKQIGDMVFEAAKK